MTIMTQENSVESTPPILSTAHTAETNDETVGEELTEPSITQFQDKEGLDAIRLQDPLRYIAATTCWLNGHHRNAKARVEPEYDGEDTVIGFKCMSLKTSKLCQYDAAVIRDHWLQLKNNIVTDNDRTAEQIAQATPAQRITLFLGKGKRATAGPVQAKTTEEPVEEADVIMPKDDGMTAQDLVRVVLDQNERLHQSNQQMIEALVEKTKIPPGPMSTIAIKDETPGPVNTAAAYQRTTGVQYHRSDYQQAQRGRPRGSWRPYYNRPRGTRPVRRYSGFSEGSRAMNGGSRNRVQTPGQTIVYMMPTPQAGVSNNIPYTPTLNLPTQMFQTPQTNYTGHMQPAYNQQQAGYQPNFQQHY